MRSSNNELIVQRGETFSIDRTIVNKDGSPYIVSKFLNNPYFLITISSSKFEQSKAYKINYFLPLIELPKFNFTQVIPLTELKNVDGEVLYPNGFPENLILTESEGLLTFLTAYYKNELVAFEPYDAVFSAVENDKICYKYWKPMNMSEDSTGNWEDYSLRFVKTFSSNDTFKWVEQTYYYQILLVSGKSRNEYLLELCLSNNIPVDTHDSDDNLITKLLLTDVDIPEDVQLDSPISIYDSIIPILSPTKLSVLSNLERRMFL